MPGPARAGALIYAKRLDALSRFYQALLGMAVRVQDAEHHVLGGVYEGPGFKVRNAFDLEGNIFHLRAQASEYALFRPGSAPPSRAKMDHALPLPP
jgi:hypothetical protein